MPVTVDPTPRFDAERASPKDLRAEAEDVSDVADSIMHMAQRGHLVDSYGRLRALEVASLLRESAADLTLKALVLERPAINTEAV